VEQKLSVQWWWVDDDPNMGTWTNTNLNGQLLNQVVFVMCFWWPQLADSEKLCWLAD
jgi:hypothetical protein